MLLDSFHKGSLDGQLGGGAPLSLQDRPYDARDLLQVLRPHQVGHLPTVQDIVDVLETKSPHIYEPEDIGPVSAKI